MRCGGLRWSRVGIGGRERRGDGGGAIERDEIGVRRRRSLKAGVSALVSARQTKGEVVRSDLTDAAPFVVDPLNVVGDALWKPSTGILGLLRRF